MNRLHRAEMWKLFLLTALLLVSAAVSWHDLGAREVLGKDENATITKLDQPNLAAVFHVTHMKVTGQPGNMQPLYFLVQYLFWPIVGRSAFVFRFLSAAFGLLAVALTYKLGEALLSSVDRPGGIVPAALVGAFLTALMPLHVEYSQVARPYTLLVLLSLASAYFLLLALRTNRALHWAGFVLTAAGAFYTHYGALFVLVAEGLYAAVVLMADLARPKLRYESLKRLWRPVLAMSAIAALCVPGVLRWFRMAGAGTEGQVRVELTTQFFYRFLYRIGLTTPWLRGIVVGFLVLGLTALIYRRRWRALLFAALWILMPFAVLSLTKSPRPFDERYVIFVIPMGLLLAGKGIVSLGRWLGNLVRGWNEQVVRWTAIVVPTLVLAILLVSSLNRYYAANRASDRLAQTLSVVEHHVRAGDLVIVSPRFLVEPLEADGAQVLYLTEHLSLESFSRLLSQHERIWVLYTSYLPPSELQEPMDRWIQARGDEFSRVPIKAISALAFRSAALGESEADLLDRVSILGDLAAVSADRQEAWLRHEELAKTYDALADLYDGKGEPTLAASCRDKAQAVREAAPRPW